MAGQHIYIPQNERKKWGSGTGLRVELEERNKEIFRLYNGGQSIASLAKMFHLSEERIRGIIYDKVTF
ncbi:Mor transcription activator family protein [Bacillus sp. J14TS2]|uniref:Mor transcription activator family protein n=1 Tax=Bacillus sp. J14TS2 TaxID=2807188 RepID=UPI001FD2B608|nr:Mor transcription activator family protein [Bacillus sp. J14TS2]